MDAVSYCKSTSRLPDIQMLILLGKIDTSGLSTREFIAAQQQLIRILTHYMIEIADRVHLLDTQASRNAIIEDACDQWKRMAAFEWRETYEQENQIYAPPSFAAWHDIVVSTKFEADLSVDFLSFFEPDLGLYVDETLHNFAGTDSGAEYRQGLLHDHGRGHSYVLSWPRTCTYVRDNSLPAMIEDYEAYRWYQLTGGAREHDDNMSQLGLTSHSLPHNAGFPRTSSLYASCNACHSLLAADASCEQCASWGNPLLYAPGAKDLEASYVAARSSTPHVVSMQAYDTRTWPIDLDRKIDYSITEIPPDHALYTALRQQPQLGREPDCTEFEGIDAWKRECYCASPTSHRQISHASRVDHPKYDRPHVSSFSTEDERPRNLLV